MENKEIIYGVGCMTFGAGFGMLMQQPKGFAITYICLGIFLQIYSIFIKDKELEKVKEDERK